MMGILTYGIQLLLILPSFLLFIVVLVYSSKNSRLPWNWPVIGMLPAVVSNLHRLLEKSTEVLESNGGTFLVKGLWFANMDILLTSNPANVHHIMSTNFLAYPKGVEWKKKFDVFGETLFNSDFEEWKNHRVFIRGFLSHQRFHQLMPKIFQDSMEELIPSLERLSGQEVPVDLQHLLSKHMFYIACRIATGHDPSSFHVDSHENLFSDAISDAFEAIFARHILPESVWRLQKWLGIGKEKKLKDAWITLDHLFSEYISLKRKELSHRATDRQEVVDFDALELHMIGHKLVEPLSISYKVIRDNVLGIMFATHDTTSTVLTWFFWLLSKHPQVETKIRQEMKKFWPENGTTKWLSFDAEELSKMVYLHATFCETLRLFPPVPFMGRTPLHDDTLPCGHRTNNKTMVIISSYAMGRMASIWGEDCHEFKPERWITDDGGIKHEPPHKFFVFNTGPRVCVGKEIGFNLMKATALAIIENYHVKLVENHIVTPKLSTILHMKHGLMVTVRKTFS